MADDAASEAKTGPNGWTKVAVWASIVAAAAAIQQAGVAQKAFDASILSSKETSAQLERVASEALKIAKDEADAHIRPIVVIPPGEYVIPLNDRWPINHLKKMQEVAGQQLRPSQIYTDTLPVENYGGGPATAVTSYWEFVLPDSRGRSHKQVLLPGTLTTGDVSRIAAPDSMPEYPGKNGNEILSGNIIIISRDINRKIVETSAPFTFKKYGATPVPHVHIEIKDFLLYSDCPDCAELLDGDQWPPHEVAPEVPEPALSAPRAPEAPAVL